MKRFNPLSLVVSGCLLCMLTIAVSCKPNGESDFNNAGGKPYEIVVAMGQELWTGEVGDTLRSILLEPVPMFNQTEPSFDLSRVLPSALKDLVLRHRNILIVQIDPKLTEPTSTAQYNVHAKPQIIVNLSAPTNNSMVRYLSENREEIRQLFEMTERDRAVANNKKYGEKGIEQEISKMFGFSLNIPRGFKLKGSAGDDFMWVGNDVKTATQGVAIYSYPYTGKEDFTRENLIKRRNEFMGRIPGPSDGSYMITESYIEPVISYLLIEGRQWAEIRGFWDVQNDFMGGPFANYTTLDKTTGRVISIDCFVHSPKEPKRNMMRQLESIVYSATFPQSSTNTNTPQ